VLGEEEEEEGEEVVEVEHKALGAMCSSFHGDSL